MNIVQWWNDFLRNLESGWWILGVAGQFCFAARWIWQWIVSERRRASVVPPLFWYVSLAGALLVTAYGVHRADIVLLLGGAPGLVIYSRNLMLLKRLKPRES